MDETSRKEKLMSKKDKSQVFGGEAEKLSDEEKLARFKEAKKAVAQRFKERKAEEKTARIEGAKKIIDELQASGVYDGLSAESKAFLNGLAAPVARSGGTSSLFTALFGANPKVGDSITLNDAFQKTLKGKANLDFYVKRWADKGIIVTFHQNDNILESMYVIDAIHEGVNGAVDSATDENDIY